MLSDFVIISYKQQKSDTHFKLNAWRTLTFVGYGGAMGEQVVGTAKTVTESRLNVRG